jgi:alkylated DNA repair dioxygenase AlkB
VSSPDTAPTAPAPAPWRQWLPAGDADRLFEALLAEIPWAQREIRVHGRLVRQPRLVSWHGDPHARYTYSGTTFEPSPWTSALTELRARLRCDLGIDFDGVLANLYRDGRDSMGMHRDDEPELGARIASVSLGATRTFRLRGESSHDLSLSHGDLLVLSERDQHRWKHGVPKAVRIRDPRINLTFRTILPPR